MPMASVFPPSCADFERPTRPALGDKSLPRSEWRVLERPDLRIVSDELWKAVQVRRQIVGAADLGADSLRETPWDPTSSG